MTAEGDMTKAIEYGIAEGNVRVVGLPVAERFRNPPADPMAVRRRLGWSTSCSAAAKTSPVTTIPCRW